MYLEEKSFVEETHPHSPDTPTYILVLTLSGSYTVFEVPSSSPFSCILCFLYDLAQVSASFCHERSLILSFSTVINHLL